MKYVVKTLRDAGLEARWGRTSRGTPALFARDLEAKHAHQREKWWCVDTAMWAQMKENGVREGFTNATLFGNYFSVAV